MTHIEFLAQQEQRIEDALAPFRKLGTDEALQLAGERGITLAQMNRVLLRRDLTDAQKREALQIGRIEYRSAGATRKR